MCGISGFVSSLREDDGHRILHSMTQILRHRGPDGSGKKLIVLADGRKVGLAHTLLAIIGRQGEGKQPFEVPGGDLIFNGAIYNFRELASDLKKQGCLIQTQTDTEILAHGLATQGVQFLAKVRGMYAFAFWDRTREVLLLGRDPFGVKPLYVSWQGKDLWFASEYKAILPFLVEATQDREALNDYLRYRYVPGHRTAIREIQKMRPGTVLEFNPLDHQMREICYFQSLNDPQEMDEDDLFEVLKTAIQRRSVADVEVGALLSGGIDSGIVCDLLQSRVPRLHTYTLKIGDGIQDESTVARQVCQRISAVHTLIEQNEPSLSDLERLVYHLDDPYGDPIILALHRIFSSIAGRQRVVVTGEGADELFSGYIHHRASYFLGKIPTPIFSGVSRMFHVLPTALIRLLLPYAGQLRDSDYQAALRRLDRLAKDNSLQAFQSIFFLFSDADLREPASTYFPNITNSKWDLQTIRQWDANFWLPDSQLFKLDKISMAFSIEAREPFVDQDLVAAVFAIPPEKHMALTRDKPILRDLVQERLRIGNEIVKTRKLSFFQPFSKTALGSLPEDLYELVRGSSNFLEEIIHPKSLEKILDDFRLGQKGILVQKQLFALGVLALWQQKIWSNRFSEPGTASGQHGN